MRSRSRHAGWLGTTGVALALAAAAVPAQAADAPAPAKVSQPTSPPPKSVPPKSAPPVTAEDEEFLEFLGGAGDELDDNEDDWLDFLANTDIRRIAGAKK